MSAKTQKASVKKIDIKAAIKRVKKKICNAINVGARRCNCGGPDCGENIGGR